MTSQSHLDGDCSDRDVAGGGGRTVVVGVKLESRSRELLTWALLNVAHAGDRFIALHVLAGNETVDRDGKSSLVKAFDSILAAYQGFCNLKQVDLKLKICRGSSIPKVLVREAKSCEAKEVIVGTSRTHHSIKSSSFVAKYCARKLSKNISIIAVNNGKIVFDRDNSASWPLDFEAKGTSNHHKNRFLDVIQRSLSLNTKLLKDNCSVCSPDLVQSANSCVLEDSFSNGDKEEESQTSSISMMNRPLDLSHKISMVRWAIKLPTRHCFQITNTDSKNISISNYEKVKPLEVNGALIAVGGDEDQSDSSSSQDLFGLSKDLEGLRERYYASCRLFTYQELVLATLNFRPENVIGRGGNSWVYRGRLPDGKELAVKILKMAEDALKEFVMEIEIICALRHENIISIFGFCFERNNLLLVYDFLSRGSLEDNLHGKNDASFGWNVRHNVAVGVSEALVYLHSKCDKPVIHRDVKSSNILLSEDFKPRLSDFGLAKWASTTSSHTTSDDVAGTFGYMAPEYFMYGKVTEKIDVYAFGVVLLELLSGRKPINRECPKGEESLVMWAKPILSSGKFGRLLDPSLGNNYDVDQMERMALASTLCVRRAPRARPHMTTVLRLLSGDAEVTKWARLELGGSGVGLAEEEGFSETRLRSHLSLALLDIDGSSLSMSSADVEEGVSLENYLRGRSWSQSSSFN